MSITDRIGRLERQDGSSDGRCPDCPRPSFVNPVEVDGRGNVLSGEYPGPCRTCGGPRSCDRCQHG